MVIEVKEEILKGLEAVRKSSRTNMMDKNNVRRIANEMGYYETVGYLEEVSNEDYVRGIMEGFEKKD